MGFEGEELSAVARTVAEAAEKAAREGAEAGTCETAAAPGRCAVSLVLRPSVPMAFLEAVAPLAALAVCEVLREAGRGVLVGWPSSLVEDGERVGLVACKAGFGEGGVFVAVTVDVEALEELAPALRDAVLARADAWQQALNAGGGAAGPWGPFLNEYFDLLFLMGEDVQVVSPNGHVMASGRLAGIDGWGRVTVQTSTGGEHEFAPEGVRLR